MTGPNSRDVKEGGGLKNRAALKIYYETVKKWRGTVNFDIE